nr:hypothetical protein [Tanacetum cinerariifolium]
MTGDRSQLINYVQKFLGMVKFGNDHVVKIMGYGDYQIGNVTISRGLIRGLPKLKFEKDHLCSACAMGKSTKKTHKPKSEDTNQEKLYLLHMDLCRPMCVESINERSKEVLSKAVSLNPTDPALLQVDVVPLVPKLRKNRTAHIDYIKHTQEEAATLRELVESEKLLSPLNTSLAYACNVNGKKYILVIVDDYSRFTWVKFLRPKDETPMFIIKFLKMIQTSVARSPRQNGVIERRNRTLIEAAHTMLIYAQAPLFLWVEAVSSLGPALNDMIPGTISSGLVQQSSSSTSYVPPSRNDWDLLFQPLFDELLNPPPSVDNQAAKVIAPIVEVILQVNDDSTGSPSSATVDQDVPSPSKSSTPTETQSSAILQDVGNDNLDIEVAHMGNDPLLGVPITEVSSG